MKKKDGLPENWTTSVGRMPWGKKKGGDSMGGRRGVKVKGGSGRICSTVTAKMGGKKGGDGNYVKTNSEKEIPEDIRKREKGPNGAQGTWGKKTEEVELPSL